PGRSRLLHGISNHAGVLRACRRQAASDHRYSPRQRLRQALGRQRLPRALTIFYSERRKSSRACWLAWLRFAMLLTVTLAPEPELWWAWIATTRSLVRPSWRKNMRWPRPHSGAVRNA